MEVVTISSLAELTEVVSSHVGPAYVKVTLVESLRQAPLIRAILAPLVYNYEWSTGKFASVSFASNVERELNEICAVVLPRLRLDLATPNADPTDGLRVLSQRTVDAQNLSDFAGFTLAGDIANLVVRVAAVVDQFEADRNFDTLATSIGEIELIIGNIRDSPFTFTVETSSSSSSSCSDDDGGEVE